MGLDDGSDPGLAPVSDAWAALDAEVVATREAERQAAPPER